MTKHNINIYDIPLIGWNSGNHYGRRHFRADYAEKFINIPKLLRFFYKIGYPSIMRLDLYFSLHKVVFIPVWILGKYATFPLNFSKKQLIQLVKLEMKTYSDPVFTEAKGLEITPAQREQMKKRGIVKETNSKDYLQLKDMLERLLLVK